MLPAGRAELFQLQPVLILLLVLGRGVIAILAVGTLQCDDLTHGFGRKPQATVNSRLETWIEIQNSNRAQKIWKD
jgi:hypothetical protein